MADYQFGYRSRNPSYEEYPWDEEWSYSSDHPTYPVGMDPDGRRYSTAWNPGQELNGGYLVQTETYVIHPQAFGRYRYAPPKVDYRTNSDFVDNSKWDRSPLMPSPRYDRPPEVEKFLTKVQAEAGRPLGMGFSPPVTRNWSYNFDPPEYEENYTRYRNERGWPAQFGKSPPTKANWVRNPDPVSHGPHGYGTYPAQPGYQASWSTRIERSTIEPSLASGLGRWGNYPGMVNQYHQTGRESSLSKPTDDINEIAEYLKRAAKPLSEPKPAMPKRDAAPDVSRVEDAVKPHNNSKSSPELEPEPEPKPEPELKPKPELTSEHAAYSGMVFNRDRYY